MAAGLTIEQMEFLLSKGLSGTDMLEFAKMSSKRSANAERQARFRRRRRGIPDPEPEPVPVTSNVTDNALLPPIEDHTPPVSSNDETRPARKTKQAQGVPAKPDGVEDRVWLDFVKHRQKKGGVTETAVDGIRREAEAAGWTLNNALAEIVTRNWQGFKAKWALDRPPDTPGGSNDYLATMLAKQAATA